MKRIYIHIILVTLFLAIPILSSPDFDGTLRMLRVPMFQRSFLETVLLIFFFYFNYFFLSEKFFRPKKYRIYAIAVVLCYIFIALIPNLLISNHYLHGNVPPMHSEISEFGKKIRHNNAPKPPKESNFFLFFRVLLPFSFSLLSSLFLKLYIHKKEAEMQKNKAELLNLRYQLQPHFLFNILNNIYSLSILKSDETPESILKLSNVMRYVMNESNKDFVTLKDEMTYLKDYISLQQVRTDESLDFSFRSNIENENLKIAPMILVNFVENAFKYGFNPEEDSQIKIEISTKGHQLYFTVYNKIVNKTLPKKMSTKIGVKNTLERLQEIYPENHLIEIKQTESDYFVDLKLMLD